MRGTWQTTDSGDSARLVVALAIVGAIGYAVYRVIEMLAAIIVALEVGIGVVAAAAVTAVVVVLRRQRGRTHLDAPQWVAQRLDAPRIQPSRPVPARPATAIPARPSRQIAAPAVHYHLHLHAAPAAHEEDAR